MGRVNRGPPLWFVDIFGVCKGQLGSNCQSKGLRWKLDHHSKQVKKMIFRVHILLFWSPGSPWGLIFDLPNLVVGPTNPHRFKYFLLQIPLFLWSPDMGFSKKGLLPSIWYTHLQIRLIITPCCGLNGSKIISVSAYLLSNYFKCSNDGEI